ncbi:MAG: hypothetical protein V3R20_06505, partial [Sphingomonadales bacterium]
LTVALLPLVLSGFFKGEEIIARYTVIYTMLGCFAYLIYYVRRRRKINAPTPITSLLVMIGYGLWVPVMLLTLTGLFWAPKLEIISAFCLWGLIANSIIFASFLATFVSTDAMRE